MNDFTKLKMPTVAKELNSSNDGVQIPFERIRSPSRTSVSSGSSNHSDSSEEGDTLRGDDQKKENNDDDKVGGYLTFFFYKRNKTKRSGNTKTNV